MTDKDAGPLEHFDVDIVAMTDDEIVDRIAAEEAMVFVRADAFDFMRLGGLPLLPTILVSGLDWLEAAVREHRATCGAYGIGNEIAGEKVPLFAQFQFSVDGKYTPILIWIDEATEGWVSYAMRQFAVAWPPGEDGERAWFATGKMNEFLDGVVVPPKLGRNDPCPCGSGKKYKRCHGL